jgi:DNA-3-methyladenine glycosylase II
MKPEYWDRAKRALRRKDAVMSSIMQRHKGIYLVRRGEPFLTLARAIVGQQISVKAAQSVWDRVVACAGAVTPEGILLKKPSELRACGLSDRKTEYIVDLARRFAEGLVHPYRWDEMSDEEVIADLVQVRGIGRWTAEMFLIFNLLRPDIFPLDDLGLQKGIRVCYFKGRKVSLARMRKLGESWRPWRSVATWYLWRSLDPVPVEY